MKEAVLAELQQRSVLYVDDNYERRDAVLAGFGKALGRLAVYRFPEGIKDAERYLRAVPKLFPVDLTGLDAINDSQLDWVSPEQPALVLLPELHKLRKGDESFFQGLLSAYFSQAFQFAQEQGSNDYFRFLVTLDEYDDASLDDIELYYGREEGDRRSLDRLVREHIAIVRPQ